MSAPASSRSTAAKSSAAETVPPSTSTAIGSSTEFVESVSMRVLRLPSEYSTVAAIADGTNWFSMGFRALTTPPGFWRTSTIRALAPTEFIVVIAFANCSAVLALKLVIWM